MDQLKLFELVARDGCSLSEYVWRIKYALAAKALNYEIQPVGFVDIPAIDGGRFRTVPILKDGDVYVGDSWEITDYLDRTYPSRQLFASSAEQELVRFFDEWLEAAVRPHLIRICVSDVYERLLAQDRDYFRKSREARLGQTFGALADQREQVVPMLRAALKPLRSSLAKRPFIGGDSANYADFIGLGMFIWAGSVATLPLLADNDPLIEWIKRGLDLFEGIGRRVRFPALAFA
jgi:glutathione S-transferase